MNAVTVTLATLLLTAIPALAAQQHEHAAATTAKATLTNGLGTLHHAIATKRFDPFAAPR
jgi:hypothetical protein